MADGLQPAPRYGHAACSVVGGFVIFGGKLDNGSLANDLWLYDFSTSQWMLLAQTSEVRPPPLTRHTLTSIEDGSTVYVFGGSTADGEFSSRLFRIQLVPAGDETWQEIKPRGELMFSLSF